MQRHYRPREVIPARLSHARMREDGMPGPGTILCGGISLACWAVLATSQAMAAPLRRCVPGLGDWSAIAAQLDLTVRLMQPSDILWAWLFMLGAMALPFAADPLDRLLAEGSVARAAAFLGGFFPLWFAALALLQAIATILLIALSQFAAILGAVLAAGLVWAATPRTDRGRSRLPSGPAACVGHGIQLGAVSLGASWALVLVAMLIPQAHFAAMVLAAVAAHGRQIWAARSHRSYSPII